MDTLQIVYGCDNIFRIKSETVDVDVHLSREMLKGFENF